MSKRAIELHDAAIDTLWIADGELVMNCVVYVHESENPGIAAGVARFYDAVIRVKDGTCEREELECPCLLEGGGLVLDGRRHDHLIPYPLDAEGEVALLLIPAESSEFVIRGSGIEIELGAPQGDPEAFPGRASSN